MDFKQLQQKVIKINIWKIMVLLWLPLGNYYVASKLPQWLQVH